MKRDWNIGGLRFSVEQASENSFHTGTIEKEKNGEWISLMSGVPGQEFCTSVFCCNGSNIKVQSEKENQTIEIQLSACCRQWKAQQNILLTANGEWFRTQRYQMLEDWEGWIAPRLELLPAQGTYTYPLQCYEIPFSGISSFRCDASWAVPLPAHLCSFDSMSMAYGVNRAQGRGTLDAFVGSDGKRFLGVYFPDTASQTTEILAFEETHVPGTYHFHKGEEWVISEFLCACCLQDGQHPLLEAEKMAAQVLLCEAPKMETEEVLADRFAHYFANNQLWEKEVFGPGRGWYRNMWTHTHGGTPTKDPFYDLGWGEGYGVLTLSALARYRQRKGEGFDYEIRQFTENMMYFLRDPQVPGGYYDRYIPEGVPSPLGRAVSGCKGDFLGLPKIWTHCLAQIGLQLLQLYEDLPEYPHPDLRVKWLETAREIAAFLYERRKENGDLQDGFDREDKECNLKPHRIPARTVLCGLWARLGRLENRPEYIEAALALAQAAAPEIRNYQFYNQMIDGHIGSAQEEVYDSENACYAFEGLVELYDVTRNPMIRELCQYCAAYFISWMYYYNLNTGYRGITRGGTTCRMKDFPLIYLGAGGFAFHGLVLFAGLEREPFYQQIAYELMACVAAYQCQEPSPWQYGAIHAMDQSHGLHWGPSRRDR